MERPSATSDRVSFPYDRPSDWDNILPKWFTKLHKIRKTPINAILFDDADPELITVMIKRENGFSKDTNDWEFLVIDGGLNKISKRETVGSCAACHINAKETDWIFRDYLK